MRLLWIVVLLGTGFAAGMGGRRAGEPQPSQPHARPPTKLGVMTFNIRYANAADGENAWEKRRAWVGEILGDERLGVIGVQEALKSQLDDLRAACPGLGVIGVGRDDGKRKGEYAAILYRTDQWKVERSGTFWLSETPGEPGSRSWKTACTRICTWARMREAGEGERGAGGGFWLFNTHLDHQSEEARVNGVKLIAGRIVELTAGDPAPVIVTGDFNAGEGDAAPRVLTEASDPVRRLIDTFRAVHPGEKEAGTFNGFDAGKRGGDKIDYVLVSPGVKTTEAWIDRRTRGGRAPSDHWPVGAIVELPEPATAERARPQPEAGRPGSR